MGIFKSYILGQASPTEKLNQLKYEGKEGPIVKKRIPTTLEDEGHKSNEVNRRIDDVTRIAKMFTRSNGVKYLLNEAYLNTLNTPPSNFTRTKKDGTVVTNHLKNKLAQVGGGFLTTGKVIGSTLAQVAVSGTGLHFIRGGSGKKHRRRFPNPGTASAGGVIDSNISVTNWSDWINQLKEDVTGFADVQPISTGLSNVEQQENISTLSPEKRDLEKDLNKQLPITQKAKEDKLDSDENIGPSASNDTRVQAGSPYNLDTPPVEYYSKDTELYKTVRKETRLSMGDVDQRSKQGKIYAYKKVDGKDVKAIDYANKETAKEFSDKINLSEPYKSEYPDNIANRDIVKFNFGIITPEDTTYIHFRAFLKDINDEYRGSWNSFNYIGRGESFHSYDKFDRDLNFSFTIAAQTRAEMGPLYRKIVYLASATAPTYNSDGYMRGTLAKITIGSYVKNLPGYISSVSYNWRDGYPWEIAVNNPEAKQGGDPADKYMQELPMVLDCTVNFKPIHTFVPEAGLKQYITETTTGVTRFFDNNGKPVVDGQPKGIPTSNTIY